MCTNESKLLVVDSKQIELQYPIKQKIEVCGVYVVRIYPNDDELDSCPQELYNRNVYAYNSDGKFLWQIEEVSEGAKAPKDKSYIVGKAYMNIWMEKEKLIAGNWIGLDYIVNLKNGKVSPLNKNVRPW